MSFAALKKNRSSAFEKLTKQLNEAESRSYSDDDDKLYWKPTRDKAGNAQAIIRFLPGLEGEEPFVKTWDHGFKGPSGKWYIEKSLRTIGKDDPVSQLNSKLWNSGNDKDKEQARAQKQRLKFVSNIYVINDQNNPENNGKVFLFAYGKKIFDKLNDAMNPEFDTDTPVNPFDMWEGANFRLVVRTEGPFPNYDKSRFEDSAPLNDDDGQLEAIYNLQHSLKEIIDPSKFKSYEELDAKLKLVLGSTSTVSSRDEDEEDDGRFNVGSRMKESAEPEQKSEQSEYDKASASSDDDEDELEYFKNLAKGK